MMPGMTAAQRAYDRMEPNEPAYEKAVPFYSEIDTTILIKDFAASTDSANNWLEDQGVREIGLTPETFRDLCRHYLKNPRAVTDMCPNFWMEAKGLAREIYYARQD